MRVRAKMQCEWITVRSDGGVVHLSPVADGSPENAEFYRWTPGGQVDLQIVSEPTLRAFIPGRTYYVDFTPSEEA